MKILKKAVKGEQGYFNYQRFIRTVRTGILFIIPMAAYVAAYLYYGSRQNLITVVAMIGLIPACLSAVGIVMVYTVRSVPAKLYREIEPHTGSLTMAYELYMTNYDKNTLLDAVAVCGETIVALATFKNPDRKQAETHIENTVRAAGFRANASVLTDPAKFIERLDSMNAHAADLRSGIAARKDSRYPEETYEEQLLHILMTASL